MASFTNQIDAEYSRTLASPAEEDWQAAFEARLSVMEHLDSEHISASVKLEKLEEAAIFGGADAQDSGLEAARAEEQALWDALQLVRAVQPYGPSVALFLAMQQTFTLSRRKRSFLAGTSMNRSAV
jgi:hypothetical protein